MSLVRVLGWLILIPLAVPASPAPAAVQNAGSIRGAVGDPLGARLPAAVALYLGGARVAAGATNASGEYAFTALAEGRYQVEASASGFETRISETVYVGASSQVALDITLPVGPLEQHVSVTAAATELPVARVGAPVTILDRDFLDRLGKPEVLEALRTVPGLALVQTGARGGLTSVHVRGGDADFNKVLIDGVPANDIGGGFSFDALSTTGVESVEVLRTANSVLYGADAMSGVVSVQTRRGRSRTPELSYSISGGNLGTIRHGLSLGGVVDRFDYFVDASRFDTDNELPNNEYRNDTLAARLGFLLGNATDISATVRRAETDFESPNGIRLFGIPDDFQERTRLTYSTVSVRSRWSRRLDGRFHYGYTRRSSRSVDPAPSGEPFDPFGAGPHYLGNSVTITGENGFSTTGRAILNFGGAYPMHSVYDARRHLFRGQVDLVVDDAVELSAGGRIEDESGSGSFRRGSDRRNYGVFVEGRGSLGGRLYVTAGVGFEDHAIFGQESAPRLSVAFYARRPSGSRLGATKLVFNAGRGIKAPDVFEEQSSLFFLLDGLPGGEELIGRYGIEPINASWTRAIDAGLDQEFWAGRVRVRASYFNNRNEDLVEFLNSAALVRLGVPMEVAGAAGFGAYVNSASFDSQGVELSGEAALAPIRLTGWYTLLDAEVTSAFSVSPATNPAFPGVEIGAFQPLVGGRPFRRPVHSGGVTLGYARGPAHVLLTGSFVGRQADSTFLSDPFFGDSMLLPNADLSGNYQKIDLAGSYRLHPRVRWSGGVENLLDQDYDAAFGFPGLGITFRTGLELTLGGGD